MLCVLQLVSRVTPNTTRRVSFMYKVTQINNSVTLCFFQGLRCHQVTLNIVAPVVTYVIQVLFIYLFLMSYHITPEDGASIRV